MLPISKNLREKGYVGSYDINGRILSNECCTLLGVALSGETDRTSSDPILGIGSHLRLAFDMT